MLVKVTLSVCLNYMQTNCAYMGSHSPKAHSELGKHLLNTCTTNWLSCSHTGNSRNSKDKTVQEEKAMHFIMII